MFGEIELSSLDLIDVAEGPREETRNGPNTTIKPIMAVRPIGLTAYETNTANHMLDRLTDNTTTHTTSWKPYGTIARVHHMHGAPHVTIVRTADAVVEEQPLVDVMDADMMRLGKHITDKQHTRGRGQNRDRSSHKKNRRGFAPSRNAQRTNKNTGGKNPGRLNGRVESSRNSPTACSGIRGSQEPRKRAHNQQHSGPGNRGAITGRDHADPGRAERGVSSGQHRRPAQTVAARHPAGDVAGPND